MCFPIVECFRVLYLSIKRCNIARAVRKNISFSCISYLFSTWTTTTTQPRLTSGLSLWLGLSSYKTEQSRCRDISLFLASLGRKVKDLRSNLLRALHFTLPYVCIGDISLFSCIGKGKIDSAWIGFKSGTGCLRVPNAGEREERSEVRGKGEKILALSSFSSLTFVF